ncbi:hypothetical protein ACWD0J_32185 [Streptomyces sp. NPDC003011]
MSDRSHAVRVDGTVTHAHDDPVDAAAELSVLTGAPVLLHADGLGLWSHTHGERPSPLAVHRPSVPTAERPRVSAA